MIAALLTGVVVGFVVSVPLGPVAAVTIRMALRRDRRTALALAVGSGAVDSVYAVLAYLGVAQILAREPRAMTAMYAIGAVVLAVLGVQSLRERPPPADSHADPAGLARGLATGALLTATNPAAILLWIGLAGTAFAGLALPRMVAAAIGVGLGGIAWLAGVAELSLRGGALFGARAVWIVRGIGGLLLVASAYSLWNALAPFRG